MYYKLIRDNPLSVSPELNSGKAVPGHLYAVHTHGQTETLQPICSTLENADKMIPALIYRVAVTHSPRFKRRLPVLCFVPGRSGIRFHRGTKPEHSQGCILVSAENEQVLTELWLKEQQNHEETRIEFCQR